MHHVCMGWCIHYKKPSGRKETAQRCILFRFMSHAQRNSRMWLNLAKCRISIILINFSLTLHVSHHSIGAARMVCGTGSMKRSGVRPAVCPDMQVCCFVVFQASRSYRAVCGGLMRLVPRCQLNTDLLLVEPCLAPHVQIRFQTVQRIRLSISTLGKSACPSTIPKSTPYWKLCCEHQ